MDDPHPFPYPLPTEDSSSMAERPMFLTLECSSLPWGQLKWVSEGLSWPQSPSLGSPQKNIEVFQKCRGARLDAQRLADCPLVPDEHSHF